MNAILLEAWSLNGAIIDALEYFLFALSIGKDVNMYVIEHPKNFDIRKTIDEIVEDRYYAPDGWKERLIYWSSSAPLISHNFDNVVIFDYTTLDHAPITRTKRMHIVYDHEPPKEKLYKLLDAHDYVTTYNEMPFGMGKTYINKFAFSLYKPCKEGEGMWVDQKKNREVKHHKRNLFDTFNVFHYLHDGTFDRRPRMLIESVFYNKKIIYTNPTNYKDGSYYRYLDYLERGIGHRLLTEDDEIMRCL